MFPWTINVTIKDDKNKQVTRLQFEHKYFTTMEEAKTFGSNEGMKYVILSQRDDLWYTVEVA